MKLLFFVSPFFLFKILIQILWCVNLRTVLSFQYEVYVCSFVNGFLEKFKIFLENSGI